MASLLAPMLVAPQTRLAPSQFAFQGAPALTLVMPDLLRVGRSCSGGRPCVVAGWMQAHTIYHGCEVKLLGLRDGELGEVGVLYTTLDNGAFKFHDMLENMIVEIRRIEDGATVDPEPEDQHHLSGADSWGTTGCLAAGSAVGAPQSPEIPESDIPLYAWRTQTGLPPRWEIQGRMWINLFHSIIYNYAD